MAYSRSSLAQMCSDQQVSTGRNSENRSPEFLDSGSLGHEIQNADLRYGRIRLVYAPSSSKGAQVLVAAIWRRRNYEYLTLRQIVV